MTDHIFLPNAVIVHNFSQLHMMNIKCVSPFILAFVMYIVSPEKVIMIMHLYSSTTCGFITSLFITIYSTYLRMT